MEVIKGMLIAKVLSIFYLVFDIMHYFKIRSLPGRLDSVRYEYTYESMELSVFRWSLIILFLVISSLKNRLKFKITFYLSFATTIVYLFLAKKAFVPVQGSVVYNFAILEITAILLLGVGLKMFFKLSSSDKILVLAIYITISTLLLFISNGVESVMQIS